MEAAEEIIRENCKEFDIEVIDLAVNVDHVHLFIKNPFRKSLYGKMLRSPPKYSLSWIAKWIKGRSSKLLRDRFPPLKGWCPGHLWAPSCYHGSVGHGWEVVEKYISGQKGHGYEKTEAIREIGEGREGREELYSYDKADVMPVVVIDEEKQEAHKTGYITLYTKLFKAVVSTSQK